MCMLGGRLSIIQEEMAIISSWNIHLSGCYNVKIWNRRKLKKTGTRDNPNSDILVLDVEKKSFLL